MSLLFARRRALTVIFSLFLCLAGFFAAPAQEETAPDDPVAIFNQGQDAHEKGELKTAIELYQKALKIVPEFPEAEFQLGSAFFSLGQIDEAENAFRRALESRADWTLPMASLGGILVEKNQFAEAEKILVRAISLDDQNAPAYVALTDLRLKTKASPETLKELLTKLQFLTSKAKPTAYLWSARAALERALDDRAAAKISLSRALALEPNNKSVLSERVELALAENDATAALEIAKTLVKLTPNSAHAKFLLARAEAAGGNTDAALKILDSIEKTSPAIKEFRDKITANATTSAADLEKQLQAEPKNPFVLGRLCSLLRAENPSKALDYCRRAYEAEPANLNHAIGYGAALVQAKQFEAAVALFQKINNIAPDNYTARANLAVALFQLKRYPEAKTQYLWLAEKQPALPITYYFLGIIYDQLQEYMDAMANYQQFLRLADAEKNKLEIEKVNLRLPSLQKQLSKKSKK